MAINSNDRDLFARFSSLHSAMHEFKKKGGDLNPLISEFNTLNGLVRSTLPGDFNYQFDPRSAPKDHQDWINRQLVTEMDAAEGRIAKASQRSIPRPLAHVPLAPPQLAPYSQQQRANPPAYVPSTPAHVPANGDVQRIAHYAQTAGFISFYDDQTNPLTGCFGNFHPCNIEFGGLKFTNSEAVFQAQKFSDQPAVMAQFQGMTGDQAVKAGQQNRITDINKWDNQKVDVMMNVLRAKFGQNPHLKEKLMATGSAYLIEHLPSPRRDTFWSDGYNGTGGNNLGICLMRLRGEFGGTGEVSKPQSMLQKLYGQTQTSSTQPYAAQLKPEQMCMYPGCTKAKYQTFKFCNQQHGQSYVSLYGRCTKCNTEPKHSDKDATGAITRTHSFCSRRCAQG